MNKKKLIVIEVICGLLIILFLYASITKLLNPVALRHDMLNQPFPKWFSRQLIWTIPSLEIMLVVLLIFEATRKWGLWGTFGLMLLFTVYAGAILLHLFPYVPCGCGGVIRFLTWPQHLVFNLFFTGITAVAIVLRKGTHVTGKDSVTGGPVNKT